MTLGVFYTIVEIAKCVVGRSAKITGERQGHIIDGIGHFLVTPDTLLRKQIRKSTAQARGTILVVNVNHNTIIGTFFHGTMEPRCPLLVTDMHKTELNSTDAPFLI